MKSLAVVLALPVALGGQTSTVVDWNRYFTGLDGTFVLLNGKTGEYVRYNAARAATRFPPCSTFKIPHTAILLDSGQAPTPEYELKYDPSYNQPKGWAKDFTLRTAFKFSAQWYYQVLARQLGMQGEQRFVRQFDYGNQDIHGGLEKMGNPFWLTSLRISPNEQVAFLQRFYEARLGLSERTTRLAKDVFLTEETPTWRFSAKTGACPDAEETVDWYVGYVERQEAVYYFALEIGEKDFGRAFTERFPKTRAILADLGVLR